MLDNLQENKAGRILNKVYNQVVFKDYLYLFNNNISLKLKLHSYNFDCLFDNLQ